MMSANKIRTWLFLRGLTREQSHWEDFPEVFSRYFPDDNIIFHDYAGNGTRYREQSAVSIRDMVDDVRSATAVRIIDTPLHIVALSLGAMVTVDWLIRHPEEIAAAVLISTSFKGLSPFYHRLLPSNYPMVLRSMLFKKNIRKTEQDNLALVSSLVANDPGRSRDIIERWVACARQHPVSAGNSLRQLIAATRYRLDRSEPVPDVPMLVLRGLGDHMVSPRCSRVFAEHWDLAMRTHATAGHDIPLDDPEWVCEQIRRWIDRW